MTPDELRAQLTEKFGTLIESVTVYRGETTVVAAKTCIADLARFLRDDPACQFNSLRDVCGADYYRPGERYEVVYNLYSLPHKTRLRVKVRVGEDDLHVPTVSHVWAGANWAERETYDMFGIQFDGHPDLRRMYLPEEFEHYPLRKDFPLMGIPGSLPLPRK
ncbi:MAG TPA: NADH-quinone oxidoreductase subunit C [Bacteroidota bacterium]|nr:NADH-quinone oxidoreductase subunit C [Bacteroidota bacterium]